MILQALNRYYDILQADKDIEVAEFGYGAINVSFALDISKKGKLLNVLPLFEQVQRGKKMRDMPRSMELPARVKRSVNIAPNFLWDNNVYVLGISEKDDSKPDYSRDRFDAFCKLHTELLSESTSNAAQAMLSFLEAHDPATARQHPAIANHLETILKGGNLVFMFQGAFVHDDPVVRKIWETYKVNQETVRRQCLVTGKMESIARLHPSLKGVRGARSG